MFVFLGLIQDFFSSSIYLPANFKITFFFVVVGGVFNHWVVLYCVNAPHFLNSFFSWGASRLFPRANYYKKCCYKHSWANVLVVWVYILWVYAQKWYRWVLRKIDSQFFFLTNHHTDFQRCLTSLSSHQQWRSVPLTPHPFQNKLSSVFLILTILEGVIWYLTVILICISLMIKDVEQFL